MRILLLVLCAFLLQPALAVEPNTNRPGNDYRDFDLASADPTLCEKACADDAQCLAWTYVKPGIQAEAARCWLKNPAPDPVAEDCCVSGSKVADGWPLEQGIDRPGHDIADFDLDQPEPRRCELACRQDANCRAYTYVKPGIQSDSARCWLKDTIPDAVEADCCISAVKPGQ